MNPNDLIKELIEKKEYRPQGVFIIYNSNDEYLIINPAKKRKYWGFIQGGIEFGESLEDNLRREPKEEVGIDSDTELKNVQLNILRASLDFSPDKPLEDRFGYTKGKFYFFCIAEYIGEGNFHLDNNEIVDAIWVKSEEVHKYLRTAREERADLNIKAFNKAVELLKPSKPS